MTTFLTRFRHECLHPIQSQLMEEGQDVLYSIETEQAIGRFEVEPMEFSTSHETLDAADAAWADVADLMVRVALRYQHQSTATVANINPVAMPVLRLATILVEYYRASLSFSQGPSSDRWVPLMLHALGFYLSTAPYTTTECTAACQAILDALPPLVHLRHSGDDAIPSTDALFPRYLSRVLSFFASKSSKDDWVKTLSAPPFAFRWYLLLVPSLSSDMLGRVLALALPLLDQDTCSTQVVGLDVVHHAIRAATPTDVRWYTDLLLHEMEGTLTVATTSPAFLAATLRCLQDLLAIVSVQHDVRHYDRFFPSLLRAWDMALDVPVKSALTVGIRPLVRAMGAPHSLHLCVYLQPLLKVTLGCLASPGELQVEGLETLRVVVLACWVRMALHVEDITLALLRYKYAHVDHHLCRRSWMINNGM
ncbi:Aste57867_10716 [Aphanomyces stellatus]|uniref:Aste57867_10716 protein n=1 Tax=Aphanomyces stellatus TaxID=120398 RepID=A0A485KR49_9STRA|nr:hypothetical protein As57867_010676 [Aphanomyces stellatus]VFT87586.1 Aste57867_10716 [Aphanomyces stellatus]